MAATYHLTSPLSDEDIAKCHAGDTLLLNGTVYAARDSAHKRLVRMMDEGKELPVDFAGAVIYYVGPSPAPPGKVIGSAGPTTSYRMDPYTERMLEIGVKVTIGKGGRSPQVRQALQKHRALYCAAVGGAAAVISQRVRKAEVVAFEELGPEALRRLTVEEFPCIVINDAYGADLYESGVKAYRRL